MEYCIGICDDNLFQVDLLKSYLKKSNFQSSIIIIFVTAFDNYAFEAFQTRAFHYLLKPISFDSFNKVMIEVIKYLDVLYQKTERKSFIIKNKEEMVCIDYDDIYFFEKTGRKIRVCTNHRDIYYISNFSCLIDNIDIDYFIRCHQGYLVNVDKIKGYKNKILTLVGEMELPVSRSYINDVRAFLSKKLFD